MHNRIKELREARGWTQADLADRAGVHWQTINRLENGKTRINDEWMQTLAKIFEVEPREVLFAPSQTRLVSIRQAVQAGTWSESLIWPEDDWYDIAIPDDATFRGISLHGAEVRGSSMNQRYQEGTALVFTSQIETAGDIIPGKRYIIECERADGLREATVKTVVKGPDGRLWLTPESDDPEHQAPIPLDGNDGDIVRIVGRVVYSVQRE